MKLYVFEHIQPDWICSVIAKDEIQAVKLVDKKMKLWHSEPHHHDVRIQDSVADRCKMTVYEIGQVSYHECSPAHVMGG